jgi:signal recognition particle receptor subunit beta
MPTFNFVAGEILFRIVLFGPPFSGKGAILEALHGRIESPSASPIHSEPTGADTLLAFDFSPATDPTGLPAKPRFALVTMPEAPVNSATTARLLADADGIVFVADSRWEKIEDSVQSLETLASVLRSNGTHLEDTPLVVIYNNRDLPGAAPLHYLEYALNNRAVRWPAFEAGASACQNLVHALDTLLKIVLAKYTASDGHS